MASRRRYIIDLSILLIVVVCSFFIYKNIVGIGDWWYGLGYSPSPNIIKLADDSGMSEKGRQLFYRFNPMVVGQTELAEHCGQDKLGCAVGRNIYILSYQENQGYLRAIVTASHEMLHIAYSRLNNVQKQSLEPEIDIQLRNHYDPDIDVQLDAVASADYYNEALSYIGSQSSNITPVLDEYYITYFRDRSKTANAYRLSAKE